MPPYAPRLAQACMQNSPSVLTCMYKPYDSKREKNYTPTWNVSKISSASIHSSAFLNTLNTQGGICARALYACISNSALFFSCSVIPLDVGVSCGNPPGG